MPIESITIENFRCLANAALEADPHYNVIYGDNASGKTSLLEAVAYLGRGKSFRGASTASLIRHGQKEFVLFGRAEAGGHVSGIGVRNSREGLEVRIDGQPGRGAAALAAALPLQIIDPDVHNLVGGGPEQRRRYLDWIAFHVEPGYLDLWRRFRRTLKQRNAALKGGSPMRAMAVWNAEFVVLSAQVDEARQRALAVTADRLEDAGHSLLGSKVRFEYRSGWNLEKGLLASLEDGQERDVMLGSTQHGPQRGDLRLMCDERQARTLVSRGQQKLLACAMILAATDIAQTALKQPLLLLLDDPAAELDADSLGRLTERVVALGAQVVATSLGRETLSLPGSPAVFHVEQGELTRQE